MLRVEHIGIAVRSLKEAIPVYETLLGVSCYKQESVTAEQVATAFFQQGETKIELLESLTEEGVIARFIQKKGEGLHHIALEVEDIRVEMSRLKHEGFSLLSDEPTLGADQKLICFVHPKSAHGVLVELCQSINP